MNLTPEVAAGATGGALLTLAVALLVRVARGRVAMAAAGAGESGPDGPEGNRGRGPSVGVEPGEEHIPRWRRPSLTAARFQGDPAVPSAPVEAPPVAARQPRVFTAPAETAATRMVVRYDRVSLLDRPDEAFGRHLLMLDTGDEVDVIEPEEIWARVSTPAGTVGWVPVMTLTMPDSLPPVALPEIVDEPGTAEPAESGPPLEDLLAAIAAARRPPTAAVPTPAPSEDMPAAPRRARTRSRPTTPAPAAPTKSRSRRRTVPTEG